MRDLRLMLLCLIVTSQVACNDSVTLSSKTVESAGSDAPLQIEDPAPAPIEPPPMASEPIPVGGSFLTCRHLSGAKQGDTQYSLECFIEKLTLPEGAVIEGEFHKVNLRGDVYPLTVVEVSTQPQPRWVLSETSASVYVPAVEANIRINKDQKLVYKTEVRDPLPLQVVPGFWLGGEPNNAIGPMGADEDCIEYQNLAGKINHGIVSGMVTGPFGRMNDTICTLSRPFLCRYAAKGVAPKWTVSTVVAPFEAYATACPADYRFALPVDEVEMLEVQALIDPRPEILKIWIPLQDKSKEGEFQVLF